MIAVRVDMHKDMQQVHQCGYTVWTWSKSMQQGSVATVVRTCSIEIDTQQGHATKTCRLDKQQGHATLSCSIDMQHGQATWACNMDMQQGHSLTCRKDMHQGHATCPGVISLLHGHAVNPPCIWTRSMDLDMLLVRASCPGCMDMLHVRVVQKHQKYVLLTKLC
jgi:hypothetical protein